VQREVGKWADITTQVEGNAGITIPEIPVGRFLSLTTD